MKIKIDNVNDVLRFTRICQQFDEDIDVTDGHFVVDGKSQMGVVSICVRPDLNVKMNTEDSVRFATFRNAIIDFVVQGDDN